MLLAVRLPLALLALALATSSASERSRRLNGEFALRDRNDVEWFALTPDGARAIYATRGSVLAASVDGSTAPLELTLGGPPPRDVPLISPDSTRMVYLGGSNASGRCDLFGAPIAGGALVQLNGALVAGGEIEVASARISGDSSRVVYVADELVAGQHELMSAAITGAGPSIALSAVGAQSDVLRVEVAPAGNRAVFVVQASPGARQLFSVPADGSAAPARLDSPASGQGVLDFAISPDGARVVYLSDQNQLDVLELFSAPIDGSLAAVKLNPALVAGGDVLQPLAISADSSRVVYRADQQADGVIELYSVAIGGGAVVELNGALAPGGEVVAASIAPSSARVVYLADQASDDELELFAVPLAGGAAVRLNGALVAGGDVRPGFRFSPNGARVVYRADQDADEVIELYSVASTGAAAPVKLSGTLVAGGDVGGLGAPADALRIDATGTRVVYVADARANEVFELFSAPLLGGAAPVWLNLIGFETDALDFELTAVGARAICRGYLSSSQGMELYSAPIDGTAATLRISEARLGSGTFGGVGHSFAAVPGGDSVVYVTPEETADRYDLRLVSTAGGWSVRLSDPVGTVGWVKLASDGSRAVYDVFMNPGRRLYSVPLDGSSPPVQLNAPAPTVESVLDSTIHPSSAWVVYRAERPVLGTDLYSAPIDGSAPPLLLSSPAVPNAEVEDFALHPLAALAAFRADREVDQQLELYLASGGPVAKVNGPMVAGGDVEAYAFTWNGGILVYRADQEVDGRTELYAAGTGPLTAPLKINAPLAANRDVLAFQLAPRSSRVVYTADQDVDGRFELYTAPLDGTPPRKLSGALVSSGDVDLFAISPNGSRVLYRADQIENDARDLFSVPVQGGTPVLLNLHGAGIDVQRFAISDDSRWVVYTADQLGADVFRLYAGPLDGSSPAKELSGPHTNFLDVVEFWIDPASELVIYLAPHRGIVELYVAPLDGSRAARLVNDPLPITSDQTVHEVAFAGERVVYRAESAPNVYELFSTGLRRRADAGTLDGTAVR